MMCTSSSSAVLHNRCYVLMVLFITSAYSYVIDLEDFKNSLHNQQIGSNVPLYYDRLGRATTFPRIGRASSDLEENPSTLDLDTYNEGSSNENELRWMDRRSVHFPRIGKRAFRNSLSFLHGRYHGSDYDYYPHPNAPQPSLPRYRSKRNLSM